LGTFAGSFGLFLEAIKIAKRPTRRVTARRVDLLETGETRIVPKKIEFSDLHRIIEWVLIATLVAIMIYALM
jgi:hypothetical protein